MAVLRPIEDFIGSSSLSRNAVASPIAKATTPYDHPNIFSNICILPHVCLFRDDVKTIEYHFADTLPVFSATILTESYFADPAAMQVADQSSSDRRNECAGGHALLTIASFVRIFCSTFRQPSP